MMLYDLSTMDGRNGARQDLVDVLWDRAMDGELEAVDLCWKSSTR